MRLAYGVLALGGTLGLVRLGAPRMAAVAAADGEAVPVTVRSVKAFAGPRAVPLGWSLPSFDDQGSGGWVSVPGTVVAAPAGSSATGVWPAGMRELSGPSQAAAALAVDVVTPVMLPPDGALYLRARFDVANAAQARSLELSVLYRDGFVAQLNGVEVARRNLPPRAASAPGGERAVLPHGGEPEHVYLAVEGAPWRLNPRDNVLAVRIAPAATRSPIDSTAPAGRIVAVAAFSRIRLVRGPYLIDPTEGAISVAWETDLPARGTLFVDRVGDPLPTGHHGRQAASARSCKLSTPMPQRRQVIRLGGLEPGQRYRYRVEVSGALAPESTAAAPTPAPSVTRSDEAEFVAAPARKAPARFVVYGDMRAPGHAVHAEIVAAIVRERPALVLNSGDLVASGGEESAWQRYFEITALMGAISPVVPALGNHEAYLNGSAKSWALFGLTSASAVPGTGYTSLDWGGMHFVVLDSNNVDAAQREWLVHDLSAARRRQVRAIFAICHDGPWSHGTHGGSEVMERDIAPVLANGGVDVLFAGHDHLYERGAGVVGGRLRLPYVISGGGGAPLYNPTCVPVVEAGSPPGSAGLDIDVSPGTLPVCPAYVATIKKAHHFILVDVDDEGIHLCPRNPDNSPLEPCTTLPLHPKK